MPNLILMPDPIILAGTCFTPGPGAVLVVVTSVLLVTRDTARLTTASSMTTLISTIPAQLASHHTLHWAGLAPSSRIRWNIFCFL